MALEITLSYAQLQALAEVADNHPHAVTLCNEGGPGLLLELHDASGTVIDRLRLPYEEPAPTRLVP